VPGEGDSLERQALYAFLLYPERMV